MVTPAGLVPFAPSKPISFLRFPPVHMGQKVRLMGVLAKLSLRRPLHIAEPASMAPFDDESAVEWARREIGEQACDYLVRPAIEPFFYMHASEVSAGVACALLRHAVRWQLMTPEDGTDALAKALAARLDVRLECGARRLERVEGGVLVHHLKGSTRADAAIVSVPPFAALELAPPVSDRDLQDLESAQRFEACLALFLGYRRSVPLPSPSITVGGPGAHRLVGLTSLSTGGAPGLIPRGREVVAVLAMGERTRSLASLDQRGVERAVLADVKADLGLDLPRPDWTHVVRRQAATVVPEPGSLERAAAFSRRHRTRVHFAGDWLSGTSTVEGAVRTGSRAARRIGEEMRLARVLGRQ